MTLHVLRDDETMSEVCPQLELAPKQVICSRTHNDFGGAVGVEAPVDLVPLHAKRGERSLELALTLEQRARQSGIAE